MNEKTGHEGWVAVARIRRSRGRIGEVVADVLTDFPGRFAELKRAFIEESPGAIPVSVQIARCWWHKDELVLHFAGVDSISEAGKLRGRLLFVPRGERVTLGDHQYYLADLVGCEVFSRRGGQPLGSVTGIESTGGADLLQVERASPAGAPSREFLIPFAQEICPEIDVSARRIMVEPPEGLLELNDKSLENLEA